MTMHPHYALVVKQSLAKPLTDNEVNGFVVTDLLTEVAEDIEIWSPLWQEDVASNADFDRGYAHAIQDVIRFVRAAARP